MNRPIGKPQEFFYKMIELETDACIEWEYAVTRAGYGVFNHWGVTTYTHRLALELRNPQRDADNTLALHKPEVCHNRKCFNYRHLYWGNAADNQNDRVKDGTTIIGEAVANSKLTRKQVIDIRNDGRTQRSIASDYNISQSLVSRVKKGNRWAWL